MNLVLWLRVAGVAAVLFVLWSVFSAIDSGGYDRCQAEHDATTRKHLEKQLDATLDEIERGNALSMRLTEATRKIDKLKENHHEAAGVISGTCPDGLRVLHDAAATGTYLPDPTGASLGTTKTIEASAIGKAVADNYAAARWCEEHLNTLIDWHQSSQSRTTKQE